MRRFLWTITLLTLIAPAPPAAVPRVVATTGRVIFDPNKEGFAYRYGPSIIVNPGGIIDAWFASPGGNGDDGNHQWDWIRHRSSADGGHAWSAETVVLKATAGSRDRQSVCDPGVIKLGDYYYLGVTAVEDPKGMCNEVFVARSKSPTGPFEKWNGKAWGGSPQPLLTFRAPADAWGLGEPSFVRVGKTLFIYYTEITHDDHGKKFERTRVATAPADADDWPAHVADRGVAFDRAKGEDSADIKFDEIGRRFMSVTTADRMGPEAHVNIRWSDDGLAFGDPTKLEGPVMTRCHNAGVSGTPDGHLLADDKNFIAYAYGDGSRPDPSWAFWYTYLNPIRIERGK
jgi:predicted GH43/DUF377 family glycosyl hydrolase